LPERRFIDANIFINWLKATPQTITQDEKATLSGFILKSIEDGEEAITTITIKDEVAIWLSRYRVEALNRFLELLHGYVTLEIIAPTTEDQIEAGEMMGRYSLGYTDLLSLKVMKRHRLKEIYTTDTGFDTVPDIKRVFQELKEKEEYEKFLKELKNLVHTKKV